MQLAALSHRTESEDSFVVDKTHVQIRFHSAKADVKEVTVLYTDNYLPLESVKALKMTQIGTGQVQDHWEATLEAPYHRLKYTFVVEAQDGSKVVYGDRGICDYSQDAIMADGNYFKVPYLHEIDLTKTPDWVRDTVWYQIFPERFANGDKSNDPAGTKDWNPEDHPGREDFYGGDLQGVIDHLDYLQKLGVNGIYFCPIFKAPSNHKYDTDDYLEIDPAFGDKALFAKLVNEAHSRGMRIMLDAVFNHVGAASMQWQDVVKNGAKSRYRDWFHINKFPVEPFIDASKGEGEPNYDTFAFVGNMPKLNTANPEVQEYLLNIATYWVKYFDIDAWRLDVANEVDHHFWKRFHDELVKIKPDFYIVGEIWHSARPWLNGDQFSSVMNYPYTLQIEDHFFYGRLSAQALAERLTDQTMKYRDMTNQVMMNMLDSHDTARILTVAGGNQDLALQALAFEFMQQGSPCIYYGTEMGMAGGNDPDCRKPMDWSKEAGPVWERVHNIIAFRLAHKETLGRGSFRLTVTPEGLLQVVRQGTETITGLFNTTTKPITISARPELSQLVKNNEILPNGFAFCITK